MKKLRQHRDISETFVVIKNCSNFPKNIDNLLNLLQHCIQKFENFMTWMNKNCEKNYLFFSWKPLNFLFESWRLFGISKNDKIWPKKLKNLRMCLTAPRFFLLTVCWGNLWLRFRKKWEIFSCFVSMLGNERNLTWRKNGIEKLEIELKIR